MSSVEIKLDKTAVRKQILQADWMKAFIEKEAQSRSGSDTHIKTFIGFDRAKSIIYPNTKENPG